MKILKANIMFILPDDFDGDLNEALECWALYKDQAQTKEAEPPFFEFTSTALFANKNAGYHTIFEAAIHERKEGIWTTRTESVPHGYREGSLVVK